MSFYAGSAGSVVVPAAAGSAYGVPMTHTIAAAPPPPVQIIHTQAPQMHYAPPPMTAAYPMYAQPPRVAAPYPAVPLTANPLMYQAPGYGYPYYPRGPPTVVVSSSRSRRHRRHSSRGFLGYL